MLRWWRASHNGSPTEMGTVTGLGSFRRDYDRRQGNVGFVEPTRKNRGAVDYDQSSGSEPVIASLHSFGADSLNLIHELVAVQDRIRQSSPFFFWPDDLPFATL